MFEHDLFISYSHIDNERLLDPQHGWIDLLHKRLEIRLKQLLGEKPRIWRDPKLSGNDVFSETLIVELSNAAFLVSIFSPRYVKSDWCLKELAEFQRRAVESGGVNIGGKSRIFKVIKTFIKPEEHPRDLQHVLGYKFYSHESATNRFREFGHDDGSNRDQRYWDTLEDLAQDIKNLIEQTRTSAGTPHRPTKLPSGKTIYLAETTSGLSEERDHIRRELLQHGHRVLPDENLPLNRRLCNAVRTYLAESSLSVQLIGSEYGIIPEGQSRSIVELQHELASERSSSPGFSQILWLPNGMTLEDERQRKFIETLLDHSGVANGAELLQSRLEDLKMLIHEKLAPPKSTPESRALSNGNGGHDNLIYLVCDRQDYEAVAPIENYLFDRGFDVRVPLFEAEVAESNQYHRDNLQLCDALLAYCGNVRDTWLQIKQQELVDKLRAQEKERAKPILSKAFYVSAPQTTFRDRFRIRPGSGLVIKNFGEFAPALLDPFIEQIEKAKGAQV